MLEMWSLLLMFEKEILAYVSDGNEYTAAAIAAHVGVPSFLIQTSLDGMCGGTGLLSCSMKGGSKSYISRTVKTRMPRLDGRVDDMIEQRKPGFRPDDATAIITPQGVPELLGTNEVIPWDVNPPPGVKDLAPWILEGLGWEMDPFEFPKDTDLAPCDSPIRWMGGKSKMLEWLIQRFPPHHAYVEVFGGSLKPFFAKKPAKVEIVNDFYDSLVNFWRVLSQWPDLLADEINKIPASRTYQRFFSRNAAPRNNFERAVMFGYLSLTSYNGLIWKPYAGTAHQPPGSADLNKFKDAARRLEGTWIECLDFREMLERYSVKKVAAGVTFTYLDPPYFKTEGYALKFPDEWHQELADWMVKIHEAGNLVLMTNSQASGEFYKRCFGTKKSEFRIEYIDVDYTLGHAESRGARQEAIISNFKLEGRQGGLFT